MIFLRSIQSVNQVVVPLSPSGIRSLMDKAAELSREEGFFHRHVSSSAYAATAVALSSLTAVAHIASGAYHFALDMLTFHPISAFIALGESLLFVAQALLFIAMASTAIVLGLLFPGTIYPLFSTAPDQTPYPDEAIAGECELPSPFKEPEFGQICFQPEADPAQFEETDYFTAWREQLARQAEHDRQKGGIPAQRNNQLAAFQNVRINLPSWIERRLGNQVDSAHLRGLFMKALGRAFASDQRGEGTLARTSLLWEERYPLEILREGGVIEKVLLRVGLTSPNGHPPHFLIEILRS